MNDLLINLDSQINSKNWKSIVFDIDWVLIDAWLEVWAKSHMSIENYFDENKTIIDSVKNQLKELESKWFEIILCTGRWDNFATRVWDLVLWWNYSRVISEWWVLIRDKDSEAKVTQGLEKNSKYINDIKQDLINHIISIWWFFEEGKEYVLSFNPMENTDIMKFKNILINYLEEKFPDFNEYLLITNSQTAVDILPLWTDKIIALNQVINWKHMTYFWDSNNDIPALKEANIWIVTANTKDDFKKEVRWFGEIVLTTYSKEIWWVLEWLKLLNQI